MLYKKRWSDGLNQDFDHLDEFEAKFYCFGGDGGGDSGGGSTTKTAPAKTTAQQNASATAQEPVRGFRGEQSAAVEAAKANLSSGNQNVADTVQDQVGQAVFESGYYDTPTSQTAPGLLDMFPDAAVQNPTVSAPVDPTKASLSVPSLSTNLPSMVDMINMTPAVNAPVINAPTQPTQNINPLSFEIGPGTVSPTYDNTTKTYGINFSVPFSTSSVDQQGIGSLNQQRVMDALTSGINNPQTTTAPTTDVAFLDTMQNVFGTLSGPTTYKGNLAKKGNTYTSASSGGITSTRKQKNMFDQIAGTGKNLANQVGLGSLFD